MAVIFIVILLLVALWWSTSTKIQAPPAYQTQDPPRASVMTLEQVDGMTGVEFEGFVARLLRRQGYHVKSTPRSGDLGVDLVATKDGISYAVQVKRQQRSVSRRAIADAVAGKAHYQCQHAMCVTNADYSKGAWTLAQETDCKLIGRRRLGEWIDKYHPYAVE